VAWYRGLSGALHGLFAAATVLWLARAVKVRGVGAARRALAPALLLAAVWAKVLAEQLGGAGIANQSWLGVAVVTQSHLFGAGVGTLAAALSSISRMLNSPSSKPP
jgi:hypothetical protein